MSNPMISSSAVFILPLEMNSFYMALEQGSQFPAMGRRTFAFVGWFPTGSQLASGENSTPNNGCPV